jgi:hypothetical protein
VQNASTPDGLVIVMEDFLEFVRAKKRCASGGWCREPPAMK